MKTEILRIQKTKTRVLWTPLINGVRLTNKLYNTKARAKGVLKRVVDHYGEEKIVEMALNHAN